jgi:hypothetical protein
VPSQTHQKASTDTFDRLVDGIKQVDVDKVMSVYEKSSSLLIFNNNGTATLGWDNVKSNVAAAYAKVSNVTLDITGLKIQMLGPKAAYVTCKWKQSAGERRKVENASGRMTLVFKLSAKTGRSSTATRHQINRMRPGRFSLGTRERKLKKAALLDSLNGFFCSPT